MRRRSDGPAIGRASLVLAIAAALWLAPQPGRAQDAQKVVVDIGDCVGMKSRDERLACFDRHVETATPNPETSPAKQPSAAEPAQTAPVATSAAAPPAPPAPPEPSAAPSPSTSAQSASAPSTGHKAPQGDADKKPLEIVATVTELHETVPNAWLITLDNGQVWRQNPPQRFALKTGQRVTLRTSKWGVSYRLSADTLNGYIQVERVR